MIIVRDERTDTVVRSPFRGSSGRVKVNQIRAAHPQCVTTHNNDDNRRKKQLSNGGNDLRLACQRRSRGESIYICNVLVVLFLYTAVDL